MTNQKNEYQSLIEDYLSLDVKELFSVAQNYWNMSDQEFASLTRLEVARKAALVDLQNVWK